MRYEMVNANNLTIRAVPAGTTLARDTLGPHEHGVVLGDPSEAALVIVGTPAQLRAASDRLATLLDRLVDRTGDRTDT